MKRCPRCDKSKSIIEFGWKNKSKNLKKVYCKPCEREYKRDYYRNNKSKIKKHHNTYVSKNKEKVAKYQKQWAKENQEYLKDYRTTYYADNSDLIRTKVEKWTKLNPEKVRKNKKKYAKTRKGMLTSRAKTNRRHAAKLKRTPVWADQRAIKKVYLNCPNGYEVDHIIPLQGRIVSGLHVENNLQYLTKAENASKSNKWDGN